ncbi:restriction endonuclease subunit S [Methylomonas montana]|uniref:restriction endonuclease subunit S n=1 Tax=Methylomonas montana TaxID=3058963 RepID=UPI00265B5E9B|nr:restriction endonuclease subunit S [Methylomonas montana]WKJ88893.1 restriction endonuclease subunit S [Methylomonas montana]
MSFPRYPEYKHSGVEWLGEVPAHWKVISIKWMSPVLRGASPRPIDDPKYFDENGEYAWVRIADVSASDGFLKETPQKLSALGSSLSVKIAPGELFVSIAGSVGKPCISGIKACIHDGFVYFPRLKINPKLFYRIFESGTCYGGLGKWGTQLNLNTDTIGSIRVALPPQEELNHILAFLDQETAKIDALIAEQQRLIALLKEKRQAVISHAVTKGLTNLPGANLNAVTSGGPKGERRDCASSPNAPMKDSGIAWLGEVPAHWELKQLKHVVNPTTSITYGIVQAGPHYEGGIPYIKTSDMSGDSLPLEGYSLTSPEIDQAYERSKVAKGDLVIAIRATVGKCLPVPDELDGANLTQGTAKISPGLNISKEYLLPAINASATQAYFDHMAKGATFKEITLDALRRTPIALPPINEQIVISDYLKQETTKLDTLTAEAQRGIALLKERRSALISAAVTGKIDVRGFADSLPHSHPA